MDCEWDVEKYRNKFEPEEQWALKRKFMEAHKNLSEDSVVCYAQVLVNVIFLGAKYFRLILNTLCFVIQKFWFLGIQMKQ